VTAARITHVGGPTTIIEAAGWRILTDPTFDAPGRRYSFGWGTSSRKLSGPAVAPENIGPVDAVLLSHDHHGDNLDDAGRALLADVPVVVTTGAGARRLAASLPSGAATDLRGLAPWETTRLVAPDGSDRPTIEVTATPCRHGPPLSRPIVGDVIGFALRWEGQEHGALWVTGDTVLYPGLRTVPQRVDVGTAVLHLGKVQFTLTGPVRYSMTAAEAVELCRLARPRTAIPVHYEGWAHFHQGRDAIERELAGAPAEVRDSIVWPPMGSPVDITV
jgi:L-ascorbate metabolism protein UlaG (beta-lactamase superfamily)